MIPTGSMPGGRGIRLACALLAWVLFLNIGLPVGTAEAGASPADGTPENAAVCSLTGFLRSARERGPAFREARRLKEKRRLEREVEAAGSKPGASLTLNGILLPDEAVNGHASVEWSPWEELAIKADMPVDWESASRGGAAPSDDQATLSVAWTRRIWPAPPKETEWRADQAELARALLVAERALIQAFYAYRDAAQQAEIAARQEALDALRWEHAHGRYQRGEISLTALREAESHLRQSEQAALEARRNLRATREELEWLSGRPVQDCSSTPDDFRDDLAWDRIEESLRARLVAASGLEGTSSLAMSEFDPPDQETWEATVFAHSVEYLRAQDGVSQAESRLAEVKAGYGLQLSAQAGALYHPSASGEEPDWYAQVGVVMPLNPTARPTVRQAQLDLEAAYQARVSAERQALAAARRYVEGFWDAARDVDRAQESRDRAIKALDATLVRESAGLATPLDVEQAKLDVESAEVRLRAAIAAQRLAWLDLAGVLGVSLP